MGKLPILYGRTPESKGITRLSGPTGAKSTFFTPDPAKAGCLDNDRKGVADLLHGIFGTLPTVSIVVPFFGLTNFVLRILKGNPQKELQWIL